MIQVILKDGTKKRFTKKIIGIDAKDIEFQKVLTSQEEKQIPKKIGENWIFEDPAPPEKDIEYLKNKIMSIQMKVDAGNKNGFDMTVEEAELQVLIDELNSRLEK